MGRTGSKSINVSCQKYHDKAIYHCLKVLEALAYRITGYFRSRNFRITHAKLNFEGFIFVHFQLQDNLSIRDLLSKSFIFEGVALFEIFKNETPSKITRYTVYDY